MSKGPEFGCPSPAFPRNAYVRIEEVIVSGDRSQEGFSTESSRSRLSFQADSSERGIVDLGPEGEGVIYKVE